MKPYTTIKRLGVTVGVLLALSNCTDTSERIRQRQRDIEAQRAALKASRAASLKSDETTAKSASASLGPFWEDSEKIKVNPGGSCPEGLWALFGDAAPAGMEDRRRELADGLRAATFTARLRGGLGTSLQSYDAARGVTPIELTGTIWCLTEQGRVTFALGAPAIEAPESPLATRLWTAKPLRYTHPLRSLDEARAFERSHRFDLTARVAFKLGAVRVDRHAVFLGSREHDLGAGRVVVAQPIAVRVAINQERTPLIETGPDERVASQASARAEPGTGGSPPAP